jgi:hypothetical protein
MIDEISGEIPPVDYNFIKPTFGTGPKPENTKYICSICGKCTYDAWFKTHGKFFRGIYCTPCKEQEETYDYNHRKEY